MFCPHCGTQRQELRSPCPACGQQAPDAPVEASATSGVSLGGGSCPACGAALVGDELFCGQCGAPLSDLAAGEGGLKRLPLAEEAVPGAVSPLDAFARSRMALLVSLLCFLASLISGGAAIWLAVTAFR